MLRPDFQFDTPKSSGRWFRKANEAKASREIGSDGHIESQVRHIDQLDLVPSLPRVVVCFGFEK